MAFARPGRIVVRLSLRKHPVTRYAKDFWICLALFAAALLVRLWLALQLPFPQLDDPASYIQAARNLATGRGLVSDVLWNYWVSFPAVTHPGNEFWMPAASMIMAGSLRLFGDTLLAAQLPGLIAGSLLAPLVYVMGRALWPNQRRWSVLAAILIVIGAVPVYQSDSADSSAVYTLLATLALFSGALAIDRRSLRWMALAGVLCGLSYLTRSHALLLLAALGLISLIALRREPKLWLKLMAALGLSFAVFFGVWSLRNLNVFGAIQPASLTTAAAARNYGEWFNYADLPSWTKLLADGPGPIVKARLNGLWYCLGVIVLSTFPYGLVGLPVVLFRKESLFRVFAVYGVALLLGSSLIFTVPSLTGSFYHSIGLYAVWAALGCVYALKYLYERPRARVLAVAGYALIVGLMVGQSALAWSSAIAASRAQGQQFAAIARWLQSNVPAGEPIITTQANSLNYATGYPALTLPPLQGVSVVRQLADRYGARFIVVTEPNGLYPSALDDPAARAQLVATLPKTFIYELRR
jgi:4-amino-4-deoxy-L-arabinose transferase-like glycosyltransferase